MRLGVALLALLALPLAACSSREHRNPFDPENPETRGRPAGFVALAGNSRVTLRWQAAIAEGLMGYVVQRRLQGETDYHVISAVLSPTITFFGDFGATNGIEHQYRLSYVFEAGPAPLAAEDQATPGPLIPWVADLEQHALLQLTPDNRHASFSDPNYEGPTQVAVDPLFGIVWTCDTFGQSVTIHLPNQSAPLVITGIPDPVAVAVDPADQSAWICDANNDRVLHLDATGSSASVQILSQVVDPIAVAVDSRDRSIWVCENAGDKLRRFDAHGSPQWGATLPRPSRVALDSLTGAAWVTSFTTGQVFVVTSAGVVFETLGGLRGPIGIAVDDRRNRIWVAEAVGDRVVALGRNGVEEFHVDGVGEATEIAIDRATGDAWVTAPGDGAVVWISATGAIKRRLTGLRRPYGIALDPGNR